jgi:uncharacterized flavoprotein (TIGR03862 family)
MAAEVLAQGGAGVDVFDAMPSVGRKFLLAGRGGLNLTHSEPTALLLQRFGARSDALRGCIEAFDGPALRSWAAGLGIETFVGTSGRVFPTDMKAAPLLRAWLQRLRAAGVQLHARHRWTGWTDDGALRFETPGGVVQHAPAATVLALGGASWPRLGSDAAWVPWLQERGVDIAPLQPSNCGFDVAPTAAGRSGWSEHLRQRFAGQPVKPVAARIGDGAWKQGEFVLTDTGVEGSLVYAFSAPLRDAIARDGRASWHIDLLPQHAEAQVRAEVARPRGPRSLSTHLKSRLGIQGLKMALLHELLTPQQLNDPAELARRLKDLAIPLARPRPLAEAISTAGGVRFEALDAHAMLRAVSGVFCAGEMLDWEAPTGGYLLTASFATGRWAAQGVLHWLAGTAAADRG